MKYRAVVPLVILLAASTASEAYGYVGVPGRMATAPARRTESAAAFDGTWSFLPLKSSQVDLFGTLSLEIRRDGDKVTLRQQWGRGQYEIDRDVTLVTGER